MKNTAPSPESHPLISWKWFLLAALVFAAQAVPRIWTDSLVNDEAWEVTNGFAYLTQGETRTGRDYIHPPLVPALHALPLLALDLKPLPQGFDGQNRAFIFYYLANSDRLPFLAALPRMASILLGLSVGFLLFLFNRREDPIVVATILCLWAFEPNFLAWTVPAKTDSGTVAFAVLAVGLFGRALRNRDPRLDWAAGAALGAALTSKLTLGVLPIAFLLADLLTPRKQPRRLMLWIRLAAGSAAWITLLYLPAWIHSGDPMRPLLDYWRNINHMMSLGQLPIPQYLLHRLYDTAPAWTFPLVFALKCPLPLTLALIAAAISAVRGKIRLDWVWVLPALILLAAISVERLAAFRYALPALALLYPTIGRTASWFWRRSPGRLTGALWTTFLLAWFIASALVQAGHPLTYFIDPIPSQERSLALGDYNFDVGQDFKRLARTAHSRGWKSLKLADTLMSEPCFDGVPWTSWTQRDLLGPQPGNVYVVGVSLLRSGYVAYPQIRDLALGWPSRIPPTGRVGETLFYWEIPGKQKEDPTSPIHSRPYLKYFIPPCALDRSAAP